MTSPAKKDSNGRNAKKSTGPRSEEAKKRSCMNALKHGLTASLAMLPDEDPAAYADRLRDWIAIWKPRDSLELYRVQRAVYHSWQLERVQQAMSARSCFNAYTAEAEQRKRDEQEVADLAFRLLHGRGGLRAGGPQSESEGGQPGVTWPAAVDDADHPAVLVGRLTNLRAGCEWLIEHWIELSEMLEKGEAWEARERFIAIRLLRMDPMDALDAKPLTTLLRACQAVDPQAGDLVKELLPATHSAATRRLPPADEAAARLELTAIAGSEIERLEAKIEEHDELAEIEAALRSRQQGFDFSRDGALMRRYETTCDNKLSRMINDFSSRKRDESRYEYTPSLGDHRKEVAETLAQARAYVAARYVVDPFEGSARPAAGGGVATESPKVKPAHKPAVGSVPSPRNEPTVTCEPLRNEPTAKSRHRCETNPR